MNKINFHFSIKTPFVNCLMVNSRWKKNYDCKINFHFSIKTTFVDCRIVNSRWKKNYDCTSYYEA